MKPVVLGGGRKCGFENSFCNSVKKYEMTLLDFMFQNSLRIYGIPLKSISNNEPPWWNSVWWEKVENLVSKIVSVILQKNISDDTSGF